MISSFSWMGHTLTKMGYILNLKLTSESLYKGHCFEPQRKLIFLCPAMVKIDLK